MPCKCGFQYKIYGLIISSGARVVVKRCPCCGKDADPKQNFLPKSEFDWEALPLWDDMTIDAPSCCVKDCPNKGSELHHFAPRHLFGEDADLWPLGYLCQTHHREWHEKTRTGYFAKRAA